MTKRKIITAVLGLGISFWLILFTVNFFVFETIRYYSNAANPCMTVAQVKADNRCLYVYKNKVYEKGTKSEPHQGHACGTDVSSILPATHLAAMAQYLDPNYRTSICSATAPTATPKPTATPTPHLNPTATPKPTATPTPIPGPTSTPTPIPTPTTILFFQANHSPYPSQTADTPTPTVDHLASITEPPSTDNKEPFTTERFLIVATNSLSGLAFLCVIISVIIAIYESKRLRNLFKKEKKGEKAVPSVILPNKSDEVIEGEFLVKPYAVDYSDKGIWLKLISKTTNTYGFYNSDKTFEGKAKIKGVRQTIKGISYIEITSLIPIEK